MYDPCGFFQKLREVLSAFNFSTPQRGPGNELYFPLYFPEKNLMIKVLSGVKIENQTSFYSFISNRRIRFLVKHDTEDVVLELKYSRITPGWKEYTEKKVEALVGLINDIPMCSRCTIFPFPHVGTAQQVNPKGTRFVWYTCPRCHTNTTSSFGTGIKSKIHGYLPRRRK